MLESFKNPMTLVIDIYKNIEVNGKDISAHLKAASADYASQDFYKFGTDMGVALAEVSLGA